MSYECFIFDWSRKKFLRLRVCRKHMRAPGSTQCFTLCRFLPGSTQCFTSCRFLVDNKLGSCTLFLCFNNLPLRCNFCHLGHSSHFHITKPCKDFPSAAKQSQCGRQYNGTKDDQGTSLSLEKALPTYRTWQKCLSN